MEVRQARISVFLLIHYLIYAPYPIKKDIKQSKSGRFPAAFVLVESCCIYKGPVMVAYGNWLKRSILKD
jgi:hypothetical protein